MSYCSTCRHYRKRLDADSFYCDGWECTLHNEAQKACYHYKSKGTMLKKCKNCLMREQCLDGKLKTDQAKKCGTDPDATSSSETSYSSASGVTQASFNMKTVHPNKAIEVAIRKAAERAAEEAYNATPQKPIRRITKHRK